MLNILSTDYECGGYPMKLFSKSRLQALLFIFSLHISGTVMASNCDNSCQQGLIQDYFSLLGEVYKQGSTTHDVERLFKLFTDDVKYEHIEYQANFNQQEWGDAFKANLKAGAYSADENSAIRVEKYIFGKQYVAVEYSYGQRLSNGDWVAQGDQKLFALFGFQQNKINLVREYW
ncbi:hypothetical protein QX776_05855 [Alteromonadaceae bacterium BrNp21-10]|nr:hypothetical protein [Alteromonadaceae bacterium BrNp21-10]